MVSSVAHVALPQAEDLSDKVVLEELHGSKHIEHSGLVHPLGKGEELCWNRLLRRTAHALGLVLDDLDYTTVRNGEELVVKALLVLNDFEVVGAELAGTHLLSVAVEELDGHVDTVLGEESDGLGAGFDGLLHVPDLGALLNELGLAQLTHVVVFNVLMRLNERLELVVVEVEIFTLLLDLLVFIFLVTIGVHLLLHHGGVHTSNEVSVHVVLRLAVHALLLLNGG